MNGKRISAVILGVALTGLATLANVQADLEPRLAVHPITGQAPTATFVVTKTSDNGDNNTAPSGTLRRAIVDANKSPGFDLIRFDIPGSGTQTITPVQPMTWLTDDAGVMIDGTQSDDKIEINASRTSGNFTFYVPGNNNVIKGLTLNGNPNAAAIGIFNSDNNVIVGNNIGTNTAGNAAKPNHSAIMLNNANNNQIGGTQGVTPGGACTGDCNLLSGNNFHGIILDTNSANNRVIGNFIGLNRQGNGSVPNDQDGVLIANAYNNRVGGTTAAERNVISGNKIVGVEIGLANARNNLIQGNFLGTNSAGTAAIPNSGAGVLVVVNAHDNVIDGNVISGHSKFGILVFKDAVRTEIKNNRIGITPYGDARIGNGKQGIEVQTNGNSIRNNRVAFSNNDGIRVKSGMNNLMSQNTTFENGTLGMALGADAFTENDNGDGDSGANGFQNFPSITLAASVGGVLTVNGNLNSRPNTRYTIELFNNPSCDNVFGNAAGEGKTYLGSTQVTTNGSGNANWTVLVNGSFGGVVTSSATDSNNNTSELSFCKGITASSKPGKPALQSPGNGATAGNQPTLVWSDAANTDHYQVIIREGGAKGKKIHHARNVGGTSYTAPPLDSGKTYAWLVRACTAANECTKSGYFSFTVE